MGLDALAAVLARITVAVLQWWAQRQDLRDTEQAKMALAASELARRALEWKERHPLPPAGGNPLAEFRLRDGADRITPVPADDPGPANPDRPA